MVFNRRKRKDSDDGLAEVPIKRTRCDRIIEHFAQQKLSAWQPVLTPKWAIGTFFVLGVIFVALGILLVVTNNSVTDCRVFYSDPEVACSDVAKCTTEQIVTIQESNCKGLNGESEIRGPVYLYYHLTEYYQNHRRYVKSRSAKQLQGYVLEDEDDLSSCTPLITDPTDYNKVLLPCGLIAWSVFNDTFEVLDADANPYNIDDSIKTIAWEGDADYYKNPATVNAAKVTDWLNEDLFPGKISNAHFVVWMRIAALPDFRKLWGKISSSVKLPVNVKIQSRYPVSGWGGTKSVVLTQTSWLGGRSQFLGGAYISLGIVCLLFTLTLTVKTRRNPRLVSCRTKSMFL
eukprot:Lankesteria_metandrocarpae@DN5252_c0_g1_i2.p1